jgi:hypothetical protein
MTRGGARHHHNPRQIERRLRTMTDAFPDSMVQDFEHLIPAMTNEEKDRHRPRLAASADSATSVPAGWRGQFVRCFWRVDRFLVRQYHLDPAAFMGVLREQASDIKWTLPQLISRHVPSLARLAKAGDANRGRAGM